MTRRPAHQEASHMVATMDELQATRIAAGIKRGPGQSCIIYSRVSSDEQAKGYSLSTQEESCRRYCADHGYAIVGAFHDAHSGTELDRPGLNAAIEAVDALKPTVVLLHDVDRLGREIIVQAIAERDLTRHGADRVCVGRRQCHTGARTAQDDEAGHRRLREPAARRA